MKVLKNNAKSVRLTDEVLNYVNNFEGDGFNEKFENLVLFCQRTENDRREEIRMLDRRIKEKQRILDTLQKIDWSVNSIAGQVKIFENRMQSYFKELDTKES